MSTAEGIDRRRYARQRTASLTYIELGTDNGGIVVNLGEGGLAFAAASPLGDSAVPQLRFRLPGSAAWIKASVQIAWIGESRKEAGVTFLHLTEHDRMSIREWLSAAEPAAPAAPAPAFRALDRSPTELPASQPEFAPEPEAPSDPGGAAVERSTAASLAAPVPTPLPPTTQAPSPVPSEVSKEDAREPWIRVELRLKRWLAMAILIFLAALLSFFAGVLAARRSWTGRLREFLSQAAATVRSSRLESAQEHPAGGAATGPDLALPASPVPLAAEPAPTSPNENGVATPPPIATSSAARAPSASRDAAPPSQPPEQTAQPPADRAPAEQAAQQANRLGNQAAPPAGAPVPETPPPAATVPAANPAATPPPSVPAPTPTGSVEVNADPYPSLRVPPEQRDLTGRMPLRLGQLSMRIEPVYPQQALREGVQGVVQLHLLIAADGTVMDMEVVRGPQVLIQSARDAVGRWRYQPTYLGDQAVQTETDVTIAFRLTTPPAAAPAQ